MNDLDSEFLSEIEAEEREQRRGRRWESGDSKISEGKEEDNTAPLVSRWGHVIGLHQDVRSTSLRLPLFLLA